MDKIKDKELRKKAEIIIEKILSKRAPICGKTEFIEYAKKAISKKDILLESVKRHGTPQYTLDRDLLFERARRFFSSFRKHLANTRVFYAFKSNDLPYLIKGLKEMGYNADVASYFELQLALKLGFDNIIYTAPYKSEREIEVALQHPEKVVLNIDNLDELAMVQKIAKNKKISAKARVSFRINANAKITKWSKFGLSMEDFKAAAKKILQDRSFTWQGIHFHSSWNSTPREYINNIKKISSYIRSNFSLEELSNLKFIDIGGGFLPEGSATLFSATQKGEFIGKMFTGEEMPELCMPCSEKTLPIGGYALPICKSIKENFNFLPHIELWIEPGRFISSLPTYIMVKVCAIKNGNIIVDGGINLIGSPDFEHEYAPIVNISHPSLQIQRANIFGPMCDPHDHWGYSYFGEKCKKNDILAVMHQGAYTFSTAWRWQRPIAAYISFSGKNIELVKREETFEERYAGCKF